MKLQVRKNSEWLYLVTAIIIVGGFIFWHTNLTTDPPMYFSGVGQSLSTDPYLYPYHARNQVLFGDSDPFDYQRWNLFKYSLVSVTSYLWMSITKVTIAEANTVGILLSFSGLFLFLFGLVGRHSPWVLSAVALSYVMNVSLLTYGRLPYLETGVLFFSGLIFLIWVRLGHLRIGLILSGLAVALSMIMGKSYTVIFLPVLIFLILLRQQENRWRDILITIVSFIISFIAITLIFFGSNLLNSLSLITRQSVGIHGFPEGLTSPWSFVEHLVSFGKSSNLFYLNPDILLILVLIGIVLGFLVISKPQTIYKLPATSIFALVWTGVTWLSIMPLNYSPLRYSLFFIPAVILFGYTTLDWLIQNKKLSLINFDWKALSISSLLLTLAVFHSISIGYFFNDISMPLAKVAYGSLAIGIILSFVIRYILLNHLKILKRRVLLAIVLVLLCGTLVTNLFRINRNHLSVHSFSTVEANQDIDQIVSNDAVIAGPYGPVLSFQTDKKSFIYFFSEESADSTLFENYPITHIAVDNLNWSNTVDTYPQLASLKPVTSYWIRDYKVDLYRISEITKNDIAKSYTLSPYEEAVNYYYKNNFDSALIALSKTPDIINTSKSAGYLYSNIMISQQQYEHAMQALTVMAQRYPTDFNLHLQCGYYILQYALTSNNQQFFQLAQKYFEKAVELNRFKGSYANSLFEQTIRRAKETNGK